MDSLPYLAILRLSASAISVSASSQLIRLNLPSPRLPTHFIGYFKRSGLYTRRLIERPRKQART